MGADNAKVQELPYYANRNVLVMRGVLFPGARATDRGRLVGLMVEGRLR